MRNKKFFLYAFSIILFLLVIVGCKFLNESKLQKTKIDGVRISNTITVESDNNRKNVIQQATRSVVGISKIKDNGNTVFSSDGVNKMGIGSGIIVSESGYILTNEHVSGGKLSSCYITVEDGKKYSGRVVWSDSDLDLAIVKVNMKFIDYAKLGNSDDIYVGESVYAIGNPIGFEFQKTVTSGIVSAVDRTVLFKEGENSVYMSNLIQTDATINPGNSGGPLINANGEVIGINSVKITSADGIGFAIPVNVVKPIIDEFINKGSFEEAGLGIFAYDKEVIPYLDSRIRFNNGIYVAQVSLDSPAFNSGLQIGDIITKIDDVELNKMCDLREYIYTKKIGEKVNLSIIRNMKNINLEIQLSKK